MIYEIKYGNAPIFWEILTKLFLKVKDFCKIPSHKRHPLGDLTIINKMLLTENGMSLGLEKISLERERIGYALLDQELRVVACNKVFVNWVANYDQQPAGTVVTDLFPELLGMEPSLWEMEPGESLLIPKIHRPEPTHHYFDLQFERYQTQSGLFLLTIADVTPQAVQAQRLQQQRNELQLLSRQLQVANEQLAYLLKHFVPETAAQKMVESGQLPRPGGEYRQEATILFADMRNFSAFLESSELEAGLDILNAYFTMIGGIIQERQGSIIQIVGDMVMAAFNVPQPLPDHAQRAAQTALAIVQRLNDYHQEAPAGTPRLHFGFGISTGIVLSGYIATPQRYRYVVFGDTTNVAFHLCSQASAGQILISHTSYALLGPSQTQALGPVQLKKRRAPVFVYELKALLT